MHPSPSYAGINVAVVFSYPRPPHSLSQHYLTYSGFSARMSNESVESLNASQDLDDGSMSVSEQLDHDKQRNKASIFLKVLTARPKSTKNTFDQKQDEFVQWAVVKVYSPPELVTENKAALFLEEQVLYIQNHKSLDGNKRIGKSTINQYISALMSLWRYQVANNVNAHPTPRGVVAQSIQQWVDAETFKCCK